MAGGRAVEAGGGWRATGAAAGRPARAPSGPYHNTVRRKRAGDHFADWGFPTATIGNLVIRLVLEEIVSLVLFAGGDDTNVELYWIAGIGGTKSTLAVVVVRGIILRIAEVARRSWREGYQQSWEEGKIGENNDDLKR